jgi:glycosyltransferase involved in cell wall biosynthesis
LNGRALGVAEDAAFEWRVRREGSAIKRAFAVSAPSHDVLRQVRRRYAIALPYAEVIPNPGPVVAAEQRWDRRSAGSHQILFVGRFDRHKGGDLVVDAFREVAQKNPTAELFFAGPDRGLKDDAGHTTSLAQYIERNISDRDVQGRLHVLGPQSRDAIGELRRRAAVTVVASRYENFPMTVVEALAFGTPLVASDAGGIPEMVRDGTTALTFRAGDHRDLAAKIGKLIDDRNLASALATRARADYEVRFAPAVVARQMADFYARLLARRARGFRARGR